MGATSARTGAGAAYVAKEYQPGDDILIERSNVEQAFLSYFDPSLVPASERVILADNPAAAFSPQTAPRVWVIYRNPIEDVHRVGAMPDFDPFDPTLSPMGEWLSERRSQVVAQRKFNAHPAAGPEPLAGQRGTVTSA